MAAGSETAAARKLSAAGPGLLRRDLQPPPPATMRRMARRFKTWRRRQAARLLAPVLGCLLRALHATWHVRYSGLAHLRRLRAEADGAIVCAGLHGRLVPLAPIFARPPLAPALIMVSGSKDGDLIARTVRRLGMQVVAGSSGKQGARGFIGMLRQLRQRPGYLAGMLVDGGRGPRGQVKLGAIQLAARGGGVVLPFLGSARSAVVAWTAWDRSRYPLPWAQVRLAVLPPILVPPAAPGWLLEIKRRQLERLLERGTRLLDRRLRFCDRHPIRVPG